MASTPKPRKQQARTAVTRTRILKSAEKLAALHSFETVTAEAVARDAGVAKGTVFAHFGDMDGLLSHLLLDQIRDLAEAAQQDPMYKDTEITDPVGALNNQIMRFIEVITSSQTMLRIFMENIGVTKGHCAEDFVAQLDILDGLQISFLNRWQASASVRPALRQDRSPEELYDGLIAFIFHGAILFRSEQVADLELIRKRLHRHLEAFLVSPA